MVPVVEDCIVNPWGDRISPVIYFPERLEVFGPPVLSEVVRMEKDGMAFLGKAGNGSGEGGVFSQ